MAAANGEARIWILMFFCLLWRAVSGQYDTNDKIPEVAPKEDFVKFVTRPDINAPKWHVKVIDPAKVSPGYWFTAPYEQVGSDPPNPSWVGPQIFDGNGELIWSSTKVFNTANMFDFRVVNVNGKHWMTAVNTFSEAAMLLNEHYEIARQYHLGVRGKTVNPHEFNMIGNGSTALILHRNITNAPAWQAETLGLEKCRAMSQGFEERVTSVDDGETLFRWDALDHIGLNESTMTDRVCKGPYDYLHSNSVDKCPDGHYLLSGRHTDTIFKISKDDGHIIWRLGGKQNNFDLDFKFSRQHHVRCRDQNETHTILSFLDNAKGQDSKKPTNGHSRGLFVALETSPPNGGKMTGTIIRQYAHPKGGYNYGRGDCELLPNGNVWMGWSDQSLQSEHTVDGKLIMQAELVPDWLRTYRSYKYEFVGLPSYPPDAVSRVDEGPKKARKTTTVVHVSWNGATEVAYWNLYKSDRSGRATELVSSARRTGFETEIRYDGLASFVVVEGLDADGQVLEHGRSTVIKTHLASDMDQDEIEKEQQWADDATFTYDHPILAAAKSATDSSAAMFAAGAIISIILTSAVWAAALTLPRRIRQWRERRSYDAVPDERERGLVNKDGNDAIFDHEMEQEFRDSMEK